MGVMLSVKDLVVNYGAINAIKGISFDVNEGEIVTLIGANGAGKTTTLHAVSRLLKPKQGEISFCGQPISSMEAHKIIQLLVQEIFSIIHDVNQSGVTILLVEQNAKMALEIANRAYVLETGSIVMSGDAHELANNDQVRKAYLGG